jgi:hypothetical protein
MKNGRVGAEVAILAEVLQVVLVAVLDVELRAPLISTPSKSIPA